MIGKICGTGSSIPVKIMDNDDLSNMVDTNDAWIRERTGVNPQCLWQWKQADGRLHRQEYDRKSWI